MATDYTRWYRVGTVALTIGSKIVIGTDTYWLSAGLNPGDLFTVDGAQFYELDSVTDNTHLTLKTAYAGATTTETTYSIVRNFTASLPARIAANTAELLGDFAKYIDTDMQSIHGKSAYEIAVKKGFTGTESEWLESRIGAGEWDVLDARTKFISEVANQGEFRNCIYRGKNFGSTFTAAQLAQIQSGTFDDMYVGDRWTVTFPSVNTPGAAQGETQANYTASFIIAGFNLAYSMSNASTRIGKPHLVLFWDIGNWPMNDTNTTEGGFVGSKMFQETLPALAPIPESVFGEEHVLTYKDMLSSAVVDGKVTGWANVDVKLNLCSEENITGSCYSQRERSFMAKTLPYFMGAQTLSTFLYDHWMRNVSSATNFGMGGHGYFFPYPATNIKILPIYFLVG
ncbi:MAG: hypothetical protein II954_08780 [Synergistaceae bacterium]|nr:hypothetical protein [Synergistaceae bacterium]